MIMFEVQVAMDDLYGDAYFSVDTPNFEVESLKQAIESVFDKWVKTMSHQGAGAVLVSYRGYRVAKGSIVWWWNGTHSLRLEATSMAWVGGTSICPKYHPASEQPSPTCREPVGV